MATCKDNEHNYVYVTTETRKIHPACGGYEYITVYIMCCSKCGKTLEIKGGG
jgi:hypothetical protein